MVFTDHPAAIAQSRIVVTLFVRNFARIRLCRSVAVMSCPSFLDCLIKDYEIKQEHMVPI